MILILLLTIFFVSSCSSTDFVQFSRFKTIGIQIGLEEKLNSESAVEVAYFNHLGQTYFAYDPAINGKIKIRNHITKEEVATLPFYARFFYFLSYNNLVYCFYEQNSEIWYRTSYDLLNWSASVKAITRDVNPNSIYHQMWNPAVQVDQNGIFHMLVETSDATPDQLAVGISHLTAREENGVINFDSSKKPTHDIKGAGNPELKIYQDKIVAIHGQIFDKNDNFWYISFSVYKNGAWFGLKDKVYIYAPKIHVADPALYEENGITYLAVSYDQNSAYIFQFQSNLYELLK